MDNAIFVSINPNAIFKIENKLKTYEFRKYIPKKKFNKLYVYVTRPVCELKYIIELDNIIMFPETIPENGDGNDQFNQGIKPKYAYQISKVYKLYNSISLKQLQIEYNFTPPQSYAYKEKYLKLAEDIDHGEKKILWEK